MKATQISQALELLIQSRQPVFLWGPPGVGKSQVVRQTAERLNVELTDLRAILLDPVDLRGLPRISSDGLSEWCSPSFLPRSGQGILFLDELNAAPPLVQAACYQLVLDRRVGEYELPGGWTVIGAGNREEDRAVTHRMPTPLANRFVHLDFSVDSGEWLSWAENNDITREIIDFIRFRPALLHDFDAEVDSRAFPSPRSWEFASQLIKGGVSDELAQELLEGTVGKGAATEFIGFIRIHRELPDMEQVLSNPMEVKLPEDPAVLFATCEMVGKNAASENVGEVMAFANRLPDEFSVLLVREAVRNCSDLTGTAEFASWASRNADVLV